MQGFVKEDCYPQELYINSFLEKVSGNDTQFTVQTGQIFDNVVAIELTEFKMINVLASCNRGRSENWADFSFSVNNGSTVYMNADQYYSSLTSFEAWFNSETPSGYAITITTNSILPYLIDSVGLTINGIPQVFELIGDGWERLLGITVANDVPSLEKIGVAPYDLSQTCVINVYIGGIPGGAQSSQGVLTFSLNNDSTFGQLLSYQAQEMGSSKFVFFKQPITIQNQLYISLEDEENMPLLTVRGRNAEPNEEGLEVIMMLILWIKP